MSEPRTLSWTVKYWNRKNGSWCWTLFETEEQADVFRWKLFKNPWATDIKVMPTPVREESTDVSA